MRSGEAGGDVQGRTNAAGGRKPGAATASQNPVLLGRLCVKARLERRG